MSLHRNLVLITVDALRADYVSCYGRFQNTTPCIDELASRAVRFSYAITNGDETKMAFPSLMTSTYGSMYTGCLATLSPQRTTLAETLKAAGYHTLGVTTNPLVGEKFGYQRGFDRFQELQPAHLGATWYSRKGAQRLLRLPAVHRSLRLFGVDSRPVPVYADAEATTEAAVRFLRRAQPPFFLWVHYMDTHWPYHLEKEMCDDKELAASWTDLDVVYASSKNKLPLNPDQLARVRRLYLQAIAYTDRFIGDLLTALDRLGLASQTTVVLTADHGEELGDHGSFGHTSGHLYDENTRVPLLITLPDSDDKKVVETPIALLDLAPTILELFHVTAPPTMLGVSLLPLVDDEDDDAVNHGPIITEGWWSKVHSKCCVLSARTEDHKLIWRQIPDEYELYDLRLDPWEKRNVAGSQPSVENFLLQGLRDHVAVCNNSRSLNTVPSPELDEAVLVRLRNLGYID